MQLPIKDIIIAIGAEIQQRYTIQVLIDTMERDPRALDDMGLSFGEFAARQWQAHRRDGPLRRLLRRAPRSRSAGRARAAAVLPDTLVLHRTRGSG